MFFFSRNKVLVKFRRFDATAFLPKKGTKHSAGYDLFSNETINMQPKSFRINPMGFAIEIPKNYFGLLAINNSLTINKHIQLYNNVGIIDSDYRGELVVSLYNAGNSEVKISKGEAIAQLIILPSINVKFKETDILTETERLSCGFCAAKKKEEI